MRKLFLTIVAIIFAIPVFAQECNAYKWWNPAEHSFPVVEGQLFQQQANYNYCRLPDYAKESVSTDVWKLSRHSAGLMVRFRTNASSVNVRYTILNNRDKKYRTGFGMEHMPSTGVSGVDLFGITNDGKEEWYSGIRNFADTITYSYINIDPYEGYYHKQGREYRLYLPLYNEVTWLEIGVSDTAYFEALPLRKEKPIVVYGTSIAQGACASRPGLAWTNILSRKLDMPLINLGFSGSGRMEEPIVKLMSETEASLYILDCLPNLLADSWKKAGIKNKPEIKERILQAVRKLNTAQPNIPILLVDHAGVTYDFADSLVNGSYKEINQLQQEAFYQLKKEGVKDLFYLSLGEINLENDGLVDGLHPNDLGMMQYARAYEKKIRSILNTPIGNYSTTVPVTQSRELNTYDWEKRHNDILELNKTNPPEIVFLANSIVHYWGGEPRAIWAREKETWETLFAPNGLRNFAYGWDRIENVLWRVCHGELDGFEAEKVFVMIGVNNLNNNNTDEEIIAGLDILIRAIKKRQESADVTLIGILPKRDGEKRVSDLNFKISQIAGGLNVNFADLGNVFLKSDGKIDESLFSDGLHPNSKGYLKLRTVIEPLVIETKK